MVVLGQHEIVPTPQKVVPKEGRYLIERGQITVPSGSLSPEEFDFFYDAFAPHEVEFEETMFSPMIAFTHDKSIAPEGYILDIDENIEISYSDDAGKFHAMVSLLQLLDHRKHISYLNWVHIEDTPRFGWRGLHLDVSRHFFTVDEVKRFLDLMALFKFNTFHWHLTDDQGWRIEIEKYPKLTTVGGFRDSTVIGHYSDSPRKYDTTEYGGFYTKEQIKEVVKYASVRNITVVPEIEMPGHSRAALAAYPELSCTGEEQGVPGLWGIFDDIYCSKEASIVFLQDVLDEVLELFPSEYIHIGGDEAPKPRWNACQECKKVMDANHLHDAHELQSYFIGRMDKYLTGHGRKLIGWDEILEGGLSPNAAVMSWRGEEGGIEAAKQGHYVVMSPTTYCYFDYYQSGHAVEPLAIGGFLPLEKVYQFDPVPEALTAEEARYILGGQANVWTEYIPDFKQVEYMVYPRALALIQSLWCTEKPSYETFLKNYVDHYDFFLFKHDVNAARSIFYPEMNVSRSENGVNYSWTGAIEDEGFEFWKEFECDGAKESAYYSVDPGYPVEVERMNSDCSMTLQVKNRFAKEPITYTIHESACLGAEVEITPAPHPKYNNNGSLNLVDGIRGEPGRWKGDQWLGFREKEIEIVVDLGEEQYMESAFIGFLEKNGSWIYLPENVVISVSADKENWTEIPTPGFVPPSRSGIRRPQYIIDAKARYIRFKVIARDKIPEGNGGAGSTPWTFIDEIQVFTK